ncbi:MAG: DUF4153 domain-containing protein [Bacilli bacterium]|nr:DUF4153 domain-containing protein [Bacilli bacterium]
MKKLLSKIKKRVGKEKETINKYIATLIMIVVTTLIITILGFEEKHIKLYLSLIFTGVLTFIVDTMFSEQKNKNPLYILSVVLATLSAIIITSKVESTKQIIIPILGIYLSLFISALYKLAKETSLSKFLNKTLGNNIILSIASSLLQTGLIFIIIAIVELLFSGGDELYLRIEILFLGLFLFPAEILCITTKNTIIPEKFMKGLTKYIMLPIVLIVNTIIYLYFLKILVTLNIPSNEIFRIATGLFIIGYPTWLLMENFKKNDTFLEKTSKILPVAFIPIIFIQSYSLLIRIIEKGITETRYFGLFIIVLEVIAVIYSIKKKEASRIVLYSAIIILITFTVPIINMKSVSFRSQLNRLEKVYPKTVNFDDLTTQDKKEIQNIYNYIDYNLNMKEKLPDYIEKNKVENYNSYSNQDEYEKDETITYQAEIASINVSDFDYVIPIDYYEYNYERNKLIENYMFEDLELENEQEREIIIADLKKYLHNIIENGKINEETTPIKLNDEYYLELEELEINYKKSTKEVNYLKIKGYILKKTIKTNNEN